MTRTMKASALFALCSLVIAVPSLWADWIGDGVPICAYPLNQRYPAVASDNRGGTIAAWQDSRSDSADVYAQRVNASGNSEWTTNGIPLCAASAGQWNPTIISDGVGGAIVTWRDARGGYYDIYAQKVNESGNIQWTSDGVAVCTAALTQIYPKLASDGAGGAIVAWQDHRNDIPDIYAQRVNFWGTVQWTTNGVAICVTAGIQQRPTIASDGAGGAIVAWQDARGANYDIYAQRVNASGTVQWPANGIALCTVTGNQLNPQLISDGAGGAIVAWQDARSDSADIYVQRVSAAGVAQWTTNGVALCTVAAGQLNPAIISDGAGGAIVAWRDSRGGYYDIYAQRVNASGAVQWTSNGVAVCTAAETQINPQLNSDGASGAIVTWQDYRGGSGYRVYAQRLNASGAALWTVNGIAVCPVPGYQQYPVIASDGLNGAIITWEDWRTGNPDIYSQVVDGLGRIRFLMPDIYSVRDVPGDQGGKVYVSWNAVRSDIFQDSQFSHYTIWRAIKPARAALFLENGAIALSDLSKLDLTSGKPVIRVEQAAGRTFFWELAETVGAGYMPAYGKAVATLFDSTAVCKEYTYFEVAAHMTNPAIFGVSEPDSGYSVDNLSPCPPQALMGKQSFTPAGLTLKWYGNTEPDLGHYSIYRGLSESFVPGPSNIIASPCDTTSFDGGWRWSSGYYYKVSAIDIHGNESGFALLRPDDVTGNDTPKALEASYLSQNFPNPFNPATRIAFGLVAPGHVSLRIYDASGRLVRALVNEERQAGRFEATWDGRDSNGRMVASGIYFYRLNAGNFEKTRKMILLK
jgi:hypothetical protein